MLPSIDRFRAFARSTLPLFGAALLVPLAILAVVGLFTFRQVTEEATARAQRTAQALTEHALRTMRAHDLIIDAVQGYTADMTWAEIAASRPLHGFLAELAEHADVNTVFLIDPQGTDGASSLRFPLRPIDVRDRPFWTEARAGAALHISTPDVGRINKQRFFSYTRARRTPAGEFDGIVSVSVNPAYFEAFYASLVETDQDSVRLVRADGAVLARIPQSQGTTPPPNEGLLAAAAVRPARGTYVRRSVLDGIERIHAYQRVGELPVYVVYGLSEKAVWGAWLRNMVPHAITCLAAILLLVGAAALVRERARGEALAAGRYAEEAARREAAEEASRAKDEFLATLSHELRNPLAAIAAGADVMRLAGRGDPRGEEALRIVQRQVRHLREMLDDLLDVARTVYGKTTLAKHRLELAAFAREVVDGAPQLQETGVRIEVRGGPAWVLADPTRLRQMIENLLDNAVKFGGRHVSVEVDQGGPEARLAVADDGEGLSAELRGRIFQPFVQGAQSMDRARGGLGLGLALVQRLAALHGGSVQAHSDGPGRGSRFTIRLPAAQPPAAAVPLARPPAPRAPARILLVEDNADARESLRALLELDGHSVAVAQNGREGLDKFAAFSPDVALVDIGLPEMDGYAWAGELRARFPERRVPLIAITGYGRASDRERSHEAGFDAHLTKPVSHAALREALAARARS